MKNKHYDIIMAWANGETIEVYLSDKSWQVLTSPSWYDSVDYRIKPTIKPDVVHEVLLVNSPYAGPLVYAASPVECNCVLVFDGDTGKLKACTFKEPQKPLDAV
jgi:hypothetical protein